MTAKKSTMVLDDRTATPIFLHEKFVRAFLLR